MKLCSPFPSPPVSSCEVLRSFYKFNCTGIRREHIYDTCGIALTHSFCRMARTPVDNDLLTGLSLIIELVSSSSVIQRPWMMQSFSS